MEDSKNSHSPWPVELVKGTQRQEVASLWPIDFITVDPREEKGLAPESLIILLHGYGNDAPFMAKRFIPELQDKGFEKSYILIPNGPFPVPQKKKEEWKLGFAWYFYDSQKDHYFITQKTPALLLKNLVQQLELSHLPVQVIGYSQGGYLAPFLGLELKAQGQNVKKIVGISAVMKHQYLPNHLPFPVDQVHGSEDSIVSHDKAKASHQHLMKQGNDGEFLSIEGEQHRLRGDLIKKSVDGLLKP